MYDISNIEIITFDSHHSCTGTLSIYDTANQVPFNIAKVFTINCSQPCTRGNHAHKISKQLLVCLKGRCAVIANDGLHTKDFILSQPNMGLLIPPTLWTKQEYLIESTLMVLADQSFGESDYIRNYEEFIRFRNKLI
ncbi:MAG: WxcM-like protein [uncultured bacterium]|nr:MAG: WxcM-like protein [uncultured bacterium]